MNHGKCIHSDDYACTFIFMLMHMPTFFPMINFRSKIFRLKSLHQILIFIFIAYLPKRYMLIYISVHNKSFNKYFIPCCLPHTVLKASNNACYESGTLCTSYQLVWVWWDRADPPTYISSSKQVNYFNPGGQQGTTGV